MRHIRKNAWLRRAAFALALVALASIVLFSVRGMRSFLVLQSAYEVGLPEVGSLRAWMTLQYVSDTYRVAEPALITRLGLPPDTPPQRTLLSIARSQSKPVLDTIREVQQAIADIGPGAPPAETEASSGWLDEIANFTLSAMLLYGYPALAALLFFGAIGLPVPTGLSATLAGSLAGNGDMSWLVAATVVVVASVLGDVVGYGLGRLVSRDLLLRRGRWIGYTEQSDREVHTLLDRWGGLTVIVSRTLVSHASSVVSLLAGMSHYNVISFLLLAILGRVLWTAAYMGLGYGVGSNLDAAAGFLGNVTGALLSLIVLIASLYLIWQGAKPRHT